MQSECLEVKRKAEAIQPALTEQEQKGSLRGRSSLFMQHLLYPGLPGWRTIAEIKLKCNFTSSLSIFE